MAASPKYKVHAPTGEYVASCKHALAAAALMGFYGAGASVRVPGLGTLWREGQELIACNHQGGREYAARIIGEREVEAQRHHLTAAYAHLPNALK